MSKFLLLFLIVFKSSLINSEFDPKKVDFCKRNCGTEDSVSPACQCINPPLEEAEIIKNQIEFREDMLNFFNEKRNEIAKGEKYNYLPSAADMMVLNYDLELEYIARCQERPHYLHFFNPRKECFITSEGKNFHAFKYTERINPASGVEKKILNEVFLKHSKNISLQDIDSYPEETLSNALFRKVVLFQNKPLYHVAPTIWSLFNHVGCARFIHPQAFFIRCNFRSDNDPGSIKGKPMYKKGKACSACPSNTKCDKNKWTSLCGEELPIPTPVADLPLYPTTEPYYQKEYRIVNDYCKLKCDNRRHPACGCEEENYNKEVLDDMVEFRKAIVDFHNSIRDRVASGKQQIEYRKEKNEIKEYLPSARNMLIMNYNLEMEFLARCFCRQSSPPECWTSIKGTKVLKVYQNFFTMTFESFLNDSFYTGINYLRNESIESCKYDLTTDKYIYSTKLLPFRYKDLRPLTRMIWSTVNQVGCARCADRWSEEFKIFACFYNGEEDLGNIVGKPIYEIGKQCSSCPGNTSCSQNEYLALCGEAEPIPETPPHHHLPERDEPDEPSYQLPDEPPFDPYEERETKKYYETTNNEETYFRFSAANKKIHFYNTVLIILNLFFQM